MSHGIFTSRGYMRIKSLFKLYKGKKCKKIRFIWLKMFPHIPITKRPKHARMCYGNGKYFSLVCIISKGVLIVELKNFYNGRAIYCLKQLKLRLPIKTLIDRKYSNKSNIPYFYGISHNNSYFY